VIHVGDKIRGYEIIARLAAGGMATLFLARRVGAAGFARPVAIKVLHPDLARDGDFVRMLVDEAKIAARIDHPNVMHVHELGEAKRTYFLVMEYVHGSSLAALLDALAKRGRGMSPELAVHIAMQVADGLHGAHETEGDDGTPLGVVHRDVSPQNVLLAYKGHVKLIDFGIAKARGRIQQTGRFAVVGKLRYMAPEQAHGALVDRRADIYSLGVLLWEMLTMRHLFEGADEASLLETVKSPPRPEAPSRYARDVESPLDAVVVRALSADPEARYATAQELRRALAEALPTAQSVDSSHLAELLNIVMAGEIARQHETLPRVVSDALGLAARRNQRFGSTHDPRLDPPTAQLDRQDDRTSVLETLTLSLEDAASGSWVSPDAVTRSRASTPPRRSWRERVRPVPLLAAAAVLLVSLASVAVWALAGEADRKTEPPPRVLALEIQPQRTVGAPAAASPRAPSQIEHASTLAPVPPLIRDEPPLAREPAPPAAAPSPPPPTRAAPAPTAATDDAQEVAPTAPQEQPSQPPAPAVEAPRTSPVAQPARRGRRVQRMDGVPLVDVF